MKILLIADGRSPITHRYIKVLNQLQYDVFLISTFPCAPIEGVMGMTVLPLAFGSIGSTQARKTTTASSGQNPLRKSIARFRNYYMKARYVFGPFTIFLSKKCYQQLLTREKPDIVHALRIPFEGMLATYTPQGISVIVSIWGNDLTLHAGGSMGMRLMTKKALCRADGLVADAIRDIKLAYDWNYRKAKPALVIPGSGGIDITEVDSVIKSEMTYTLPTFPEDTILVVNPRGFRPGSVRNDTFFKAIPAVIKACPNVHFLCPAMFGQIEAQKWIEELRIKDHVTLLPLLEQHDLWRLFAKAKASISVSQHDGVPNSLLEAMTIGCFPIVGNIASVREWIEDKKNGLVVDPGDTDELSRAIIRAISSPELQKSAAAINRDLIRSRAEISVVRLKLAQFYQQYQKQ